ncbi:MAG: hypothetical protein J5802_03940 [Butyrivibrio sp.]|nr:hypothetical protein [Butyrivibrio sp.]
MTIAAIVLSVIGLITSFTVVGIIPSLAGAVISVMCLLREKTISAVRALAMSVVGALVPVIMYLNSFGFALPYEKSEELSILSQIIYDNYTNMGLDMQWLVESELEKEQIFYINTDDQKITSTAAKDKTVVFEVVGESTDKDGSLSGKTTEGTGDKGKIEGDGDFKPASIQIGASDDNMPSYGGIPRGTSLIAQYFREDDHNCNPVLVLQNNSGKELRYECRFIARNDDGDELSVSEKTVEVVQDGAKFVFEGRFDKRELNGKLPTMYEFSVTKRNPYEKDRLNDIAIHSKAEGNSVVVEAKNLCDKKVKVDAFVLFFDGAELVDCIWLIPASNSNVYVEPNGVGTVKGDAYYRFDRVETYYTAYEAVDEAEEE